MSERTNGYIFKKKFNDDGLNENSYICPCSRELKKNQFFNSNEQTSNMPSSQNPL